MKTCIVLSDLAYPIVLKQSETGNKLFTVSYGTRVKRGMTYSEACMDFGTAVFHALACESKLDNEGA